LFCYLGSSAPEILLAIIGVVGNGFEAEALGPGTIVGSAAFNLLGISAVCIAGIPSGESRRYRQNKLLRMRKGPAVKPVFLARESAKQMRYTATGYIGIFFDCFCNAKGK
jgi:hypothetical protein